MKKTTRYGYTRKGTKVELNILVDVDGGKEGWVLNENGHAVKVYIPTN